MPPKKTSKAKPAPKAKPASKAKPAKRSPPAATKKKTAVPGKKTKTVGKTKEASHKEESKPEQTDAEAAAEAEEYFSGHKLTDDELVSQGSDNILRAMFNIAIELPMAKDQPKMERILARNLMACTERAVKLFGLDDNYRVLVPMLLSKTGQEDDAIAFTVRNFEENPSFGNCIAMANAQRRAGRFDDALQSFRKATTIRETDTTCFLEIGDMWLTKDDYEKALSAYNEALGRNSSEVWAVPSSYYCRHMLGHKEEDWVAKLKEIADSRCDCGMDLMMMLTGVSQNKGPNRAADLLDMIEAKEKA